MHFGARTLKLSDQVKTWATGFVFPVQTGTFLFVTCTMSVLGPMQPRIQ
jgi:hypothetical protein